MSNVLFVVLLENAFVLFSCLHVYIYNVPKKRECFKLF